jgi:hypothetical protein
MAPADAIILRHGAPQFNDNWPLTQPGSLADKAPHLANVRFAPSKRTCAPLPRYVRLCQFLEDWICEDNPVRAIDVFVDELDLAELGFGGVDPEATGRPAYHPSVLLKLYIYGYLNRVQSSRRLEREAGRNVEVMWLTGRLAPDQCAGWRRHFPRLFGPRAFAPNSFRTLMSRKRWLRLLGVTQGPCQHPAGVLAHALVMICIAEMKRELPRFLPIQR